MLFFFLSHSHSPSLSVVYLFWILNYWIHDWFPKKYEIAVVVCNKTDSNEFQFYISVILDWSMSFTIICNQTYTGTIFRVSEQKRKKERKRRVTAPIVALSIAVKYSAHTHTHIHSITYTRNSSCQQYHHAYTFFLCTCWTVAKPCGNWTTRP